MLPNPVAQGLLYHSQAACCRRLTLARLNKPRRLLLELKRVSAPLPIPHLRYPFALEQLAKGYVLRGQGQAPRFSLTLNFIGPSADSFNTTIEVISNLVDPEAHHIPTQLKKPLIPNLIAPTQLAIPIPMVPFSVNFNIKHPVAIHEG